MKHDLTCWLAEHGVMEKGDPMPPCDGQLVRCHLIAKSELRKLWKSAHHGGPHRPEILLDRLPASLEVLWKDERTWVWGCGGPMGNAGHHGMLDFSKRLRVPFAALPTGTLQLAAYLGLMPWLERTYQ